MVIWGTEVHCLSKPSKPLRATTLKWAWGVAWGNHISQWGRHKQKHYLLFQFWLGCTEIQLFSLNTGDSNPQSSNHFQQKCYPPSIQGSFGFMVWLDHNEKIDENWNIWMMTQQCTEWGLLITVERTWAENSGTVTSVLLHAKAEQLDKQQKARNWYRVGIFLV